MCRARANSICQASRRNLFVCLQIAQCICSANGFLYTENLIKLLLVAYDKILQRSNTIFIGRYAQKGMQYRPDVYSVARISNPATINFALLPLQYNGAVHERKSNRTRRNQK